MIAMHREEAGDGAEVLVRVVEIVRVELELVVVEVAVRGLREDAVSIRSLVAFTHPESPPFSRANRRIRIEFHLGVLSDVYRDRPPPDKSKECQLPLMHDHKIYTLSMTVIIEILALRDREISGTADRDPTCITLLSKKSYRFAV